MQQRRKLSGKEIKRKGQEQIAKARAAQRKSIERVKERQARQNEKIMEQRTKHHERRRLSFMYSTVPSKRFANSTTYSPKYSPKYSVLNPQPYHSSESEEEKKKGK